MLARHWIHGPTLTRCFRFQFSKYATSAVARPQKPGATGLAQLEDEGVRVLRIVKKRIDERARLLSEMSEEMSSPEDVQRAKQAHELQPLQTAWDEWIHTKQLLVDTLELLNDPDDAMRSLASDEYRQLTSTLSHQLNTVFPSLLLRASPTAHLSALMELKAGVGGSEASLFASELLRMYTRLASSMKWKANLVSSNETEGGGIKDAIVEVKGEGAYDMLRWESGVHRVQRIPATESSGRTHTSTVSLVVLPLVEETDETRDNELFKMADVKIEVMRARGAGGQHVNKTESAVRLTHIPTGITVSMQDERSQHTNKRRAFQVLRARLMDAKLICDVAERRATRRNLVQSADRSAKIRTYNYSQDRVTDHRIGLSLMNLESILEGEGLQDILYALKKDHEETVMEDMLDES